MASYPPDRFDTVPDDLSRVGAHRGPKRKGRGWIGFAWAALATLVLIVGGLFVLVRVVGINIDIPFLTQPTATPTAPSTPEPTETPVTDAANAVARGIQITVLNGTGVSGIQDRVGDELAAGGWPIATRTTAAETVDKTFIYFSDPANEDVAAGVAAALGIGQISLVSPDIYPGQPIVIAVGVDSLREGEVPPAEEAPAEEPPAEEEPADE